MEWHLFETRRILGCEEQTEQQRDALRLLQWIADQDLQETSPRFLQQYGPVRNKIRRNKAIQLLAENHYMREKKVDNKTVLFINPCITKSQSN